MWLAIFSIAITFLILDFIWIYLVNKSTWDEQISLIQNESPMYRPFAGLFVYTIMIFSTWYFVVKNVESPKDAIIPGALLGLAMYGVFDGTNHVMFKNYSGSLAIQDTIYGMIATAAASAVGVCVLQ